MSRSEATMSCEWAEMACAFALQALPSNEVAAVETHVRGCALCQRELAALRPVFAALASCDTDVLRPDASLQDRLARRIAAEAGTIPVLPSDRSWREPEWETVAPGIECKLLANDTLRQRVSMLVRLARGAEYPPHTHGGTEELHLLAGELWIDDRKLQPGDYNRGEPGTGDRRVWSETGCTCVLVTSTQDILG